MSIPDVEPIRSFLQDLTFVKPAASGYDSMRIASSALASDAGRVTSDPGVSIWYRIVGDFSMKSLVARIQHELSNRGHVATPPLASLVAGIFALSGAKSEQPVKALNELLNSIAEADLYQFYTTLLPTPPGFTPFAFGSFRIGPLNSESIKQLTLQVGSPDFFAREQQFFRGGFAVSRSKQTCQIVNIERCADILDVQASDERGAKLLTRLATAYFHELSQVSADDFWSTFDAEQRLQVCFDAPYLDVKNIANIVQTLMLSVYQFRGTGRG